MENHHSNAAAELFPFMSTELKNSFFTCYKTYGKISTQKLISCFQDPIAVKATSKVTTALENRYDIPNPPPKIFLYQEEEGVAWLRDMPVGPGVSPCVNNTCGKLLSESPESTISNLDFFQKLCGTAVELSRIIRIMKIDVAELLMEFYRCD